MSLRAQCPLGHTKEQSWNFNADLSLVAVLSTCATTSKWPALSGSWSQAPEQGSGLRHYYIDVCGSNCPLYFWAKCLFHPWLFIFVLIPVCSHYDYCLWRTNLCRQITLDFIPLMLHLRWIVWKHHVFVAWVQMVFCLVICSRLWDCAGPEGKWLQLSSYPFRCFGAWDADLGFEHLYCWWWREGWIGMMYAKYVRLLLNNIAHIYGLAMLIISQF